MLSAAEIAAIKKDLAALKKAYEDVADSGIRKVIQEWILDAEKMLAREKEFKSSPSVMKTDGITQVSQRKTALRHGR